MCEGGGCVRGSASPLLEAIVGSSRESIIIRMTNPPIAMMITALHQMSTCQTGEYSSGKKCYIYLGVYAKAGSRCPR